MNDFPSVTRFKAGILKPETQVICNDAFRDWVKHLRKKLVDYRDAESGDEGLQVFGFLSDDLIPELENLLDYG